MLTMHRRVSDAPPIGPYRRLAYLGPRSSSLPTTNVHMPDRPRAAAADVSRTTCLAPSFVLLIICCAQVPFLTDSSAYPHTCRHPSQPFPSTCLAPLPTHIHCRCSASNSVISTSPAKLLPHPTPPRQSVRIATVLLCFIQPIFLLSLPAHLTLSASNLITAVGATLYIQLVDDYKTPLPNQSHHCDLQLQGELANPRDTFAGLLSNPPLTSSP